MSQRFTLACCALTVLLLPSNAARAQEADSAGPDGATAVPGFGVLPGNVAGAATTATPWRVDFSGAPAPGPLSPAPAFRSSPPPLADAQAERPRAVAFEYSDAYMKRRKIHVYASIAMLPLFVTQYAIGNSLYDSSTDGKRTAHAVVGAGIGALFGVNTVTGVWNLWEGRKDPAHRARRVTHGLMMLGADAGFVATALTAPGDDGGGNRSTHRAIALTSIGVATASYLFMLFTR